jgi:CheY-like chemotaxis protein
MMKTTIVLDDDVERHELFNRWLGDCFYSVYTAEDLLKRLRLGSTAKVLFLDHDLGSSTAMDGTALIKAMREENIALPTVDIIYIHSNNNSKNQYMQKELQALYPKISVNLAPITWLGDKWVEYGRDRTTFKKILLGE